MNGPLIQAEEKEKILAILGVGGTRDMAAQYIGCHPRTLRRAAERDPEFAKKIIQAETTLENACLDTISKASRDPKYWRCAIWALDRVYPQRYAQGKRDMLSSKQIRDITEGVVGVVLSALPESVITPELRERLEEISETRLIENQRNGHM